jgi:catechol 2,3-dioxygenase-like lactoylglutathione lyase family enzyme
MPLSLHLHHISLQVSDLEASARFYSDVLGLPEIENRTDKAQRRWFGLDGRRAIHLIGGSAPGRTHKPMATHLALATARFDQALSTKETGVSPSEIFQARTEDCG